MTYLEAVNKVLLRLRETQVSTVAENTYSALIGEFVNDAHKFVADSWNWSQLRSTIVVSTTADDYSYNLSGSGDDFRVDSVVNDTSNFFMKYADRDWFEKSLYIVDGSTTGSPLYYTYDGVDSTTGDSKVLVYPIPDGVFSLRFRGTVDVSELSSDSTSILVPHIPVVQLATALAARERGETGGTSAAELFAIADKSLSDAIAFDANKHPEELIFKAV